MKISWSYKDVSAEISLSYCLMFVLPLLVFVLSNLNPLAFIVSLSWFVFVILPAYVHPCLWIYFYLSLLFCFLMTCDFSLACLPSFPLPSGPGSSVPAFPCGVMPLIPTAYKQLVLWLPALWSPVTPCSCI